MTGVTQEIADKAQAQTTAVAVAPRADLVAGAAVTPIVPRTVEEAHRLATAFHRSGMAPKSLATAEQVLVAILAGAELGLAPFAAMQSFAIINGRPALWGDAIPALLWAKGFELTEWTEGEGDQMVARCEVKRPSGKVIPGEFSMADAKQAGLSGKDGPWKTATKRMLKMRARAFAARDGASDVLRGFQVYEEVKDYAELRSEALAAPSPTVELHGGFSQIGPVGASSGPSEVIDVVPEPVHTSGYAEVVDPRPEPPPEPAFDVVAWANKFADELPEFDDADAMRSRFDAHKAELRLASENGFLLLNRAVAERAIAIAKKAR